MAQPTWTFLRVVNRVLRNMRKPKITDVRSQTLPVVAQDVIEVVREEYQEFCSLQDWHWLRRSAYLELNAEVTGSAGVTNDSTSVTSPTSWDDAYVGRKIKFSSYDEEYVILTGSTSSAIILDRSYKGSTSTSESYTIFDDDYALPDNFSRFITINKFIGGGRIRLVGIQEFREHQYEGRHFAPTIGATSPLMATIVNSSEAHDTDSAPQAPVLLVRPWPQDAISLPYDYIKVPTELEKNDDTFDIPQDDISALIHRVMIPMFVYIEEDGKAAVAADLYNRKYSEMTGEKLNIDDNLKLVAVNRDRARF